VTVRDLLTVSQYAQRKGVDASLIRRYKREGRLVVDPGTGRIDAVKSDLLLPSVIDPGKSKKMLSAPAHQAPAGAAGTGTAPPLGSIEDQRTLAEAKRNESLARTQLHLLEIAERAGALLDRSKVEMQLARIGRQIIEALGTVADRVAAQAAGEFGIDAGRLHALIDAEMRRTADEARRSIEAVPAAAVPE